MWCLKPPGAGGLDLVSLGIQRGRDLGLPNYNQARLDMGLTPVSSFSEITSNVEIQQALLDTYGTIDDVDAWVGGLAEEHSNGAIVGELFATMIAEQFERLRDGDRFWYQNGQLTTDELMMVEDTTLASLIERNTTITGLTGSLFNLDGTSITTTNIDAVNNGNGSEVRSFDGSGNNLIDTSVGSRGENLSVDFTSDYEDGFSTPTGSNRPSARVISNNILNQDTDILSTNASLMSVFWGQLVAHDLSLTATGISNTLEIHGDDLDAEGVAYPFVAEKLPLVLESQLYQGVDNVIDRPIYLPQLDIANAVTINPNVDTVVTTNNIPNAEVMVKAGSLIDRDGTPFTGALSITEVPTSLTPASLPEGLSPEMVVTIQPSEMVFTTPAPLSLPNNAGWAPGVEMDLWSINPTTGEFEVVGKSVVSADGSKVETVTGGIRNSSWHFVAPPPTPDEVFNNGANNGAFGSLASSSSNNVCQEQTQSCPFSSGVEFNTGAVVETHSTVTYKSNGQTRGLTLTYDSLRADPRPILSVSYQGVNPFALSNNPSDNLRLVGELMITGEGFNYQVPGFAGGEYGLDGGEHFWSIPDQVGDLYASIQADLSNLPTGKYDYDFNSGIRLFFNEQFLGTSTITEGKLLHINKIDSYFGAGWSIAGWQEIVENSDGSILLIDGDGGEIWFDIDSTGNYINPPGDFSTLEKISSGGFRRTMKNQTVYLFNSDNQLASMSDTNGNITSYVYNTQQRLEKIIDPVGLETVFNYNAQGKVEKITDPANRDTLLEYDSLGNLVKITDPDNASRIWDYDNLHHMTGETDAVGNTEQAFYDEFGRATSSVRKDGTTINIQPVEVQKGLYLPTQTINPLSPPLVLMTESGNSVTASYGDSNGNVLSSQLDAAGQQISSTDGGGETGSVKRNEENLVTQNFDPQGDVTDYEYDDRGNLLHISEQNGSFELSAPIDTPTGSQPTALISGDFNGDGNADIVTNNSNDDSLTILKGDGNGNFTQIEEYLVGRSLHSLTLGDFNNDSNLDLAVVNRSFNNFENRVTILTGNGDSTFVEFDNYVIDSIWIDTISIADIDLDGNLDLISGYRIEGGGYEEEDYFLGVSLGNGDGTFEQPINQELDDEVISITIEDIDDDGNQDVITTNYFSDSISILNGNGDGTLSFQSNFSFTSDVDSLALKDINGDGKLEMAIVSTSQNQIVVIKGNENGTFTRLSTYSLPEGSRPINVAFADLNGDGRLDLVTNYLGGNPTVPDIANNSIIVWLGDGEGSFNSLNHFEVGNSFADFLLVDVNTDGDFDIITVNPNDYNISVLINQQNGEFNERFYTYEPVFNQLTSYTDEIGRVTLYEIDSDNGNVVSTTRVVGELDALSNGETDDVITRYTYTNAGLIDKMTDANGQITDYNYHLDTGNLIEIIYAFDTSEEAIVRYEYDTAGNQIAYIDENNNRTEYEYDNANRLIKTRYAVGSVSDEAVEMMDYDDNGNPIIMTDGLGNVTEYVYDTQDRLIKVIEADPDGAGPLSNPVTINTYDGNGNLVSTIDPLNRETRYIYDSRNRLIEIIQPDGNTTEAHYDNNNNNLVSTTDQTGNLTTNIYDYRDRLIREIDAEGNETKYEYDRANQLIALIDGNDNRTEFEYDDLGRQIKVTDAEGNITSYEYDKVGNVTATIDPNGNRTEYEYDARNRQTLMRDVIDGGDDIITSTTYDDVNNVLSITDSVNNQTTL